MCSLCFRHYRRLISEEGNLEVHLRSGLHWITGSPQQAEKIKMILLKLQEERREAVMKALCESKMVVEEKDLIKNEQEEENSDIMDCDYKLQVPSNAEKDDIESCFTRFVPGECAICLSQYNVGDSVLWSRNKLCLHAFHEDCILAWLMKKQNIECPCCRRDFISEAESASETE